MGLIAMSERDLQRIEVLSKVVARRMTIVAAAHVLVLSPRQVRRLLERLQTDGAAAIRHKARGQPSNNRIALLPDIELGPESRLAYDHQKPVLFGHYWLLGEPKLSDPSRLCLDYSVAKGGHLAAYQWDGETELDPGKLVYVSQTKGRSS